MRPSAKLKAAQDVLDILIFGEMSSKKIVNWERNNKFAGSKDRQYIRDIVYHCLRNKTFFLYPWRHENISSPGRSLILSYLYNNMNEVIQIGQNEFFGNRSFDFLPISDYEKRVLTEKSVARHTLEKSNVKYSYPLFLDKEIKISLEDSFEKVMNLSLSRAQVFIRANKIKISTIKLIKNLKSEGFDVECVPNDTEIIRVLKPTNKIKLSPLFLDGCFEFQDFGSQKVTEMMPIYEDMSVLDYCAGAGGKSLALASSFKNMLDLNAYDCKVSRLKSFKERANRASAKIVFLNAKNVLNSAYDLIFVDVPCSGSGTWRRDPVAKWNLSQTKLKQLLKSQLSILNKVSSNVVKGGCLCYITCSILRCENQGIIERFILNNENYELIKQRVISPVEGGDGFYIAILKKVE